MYSTCLFCHADLGRNEAIERFPIGRRLAYDAAKGRLWVVCRRCERWNLTPLEERWEAIEDAERLYRGTRLRASTDNVGLARVADGTELVRIGEPLRPEFAAWRYGDQFGRRYRRHLALGGAGAALAAAWVLGGPAIGFAGLASAQPALMAYNWTRHVLRARQRASVRVRAANTPLVVKGDELLAVRLTTAHNTGLAMWVSGVHRLPNRTQNVHYVLEGAEAIRAAGQLLPVLNRNGGSRAEVWEAVERLDGAGSTERLFASVADEFDPRYYKPPWSLWERDAPNGLARIPAAARLALEMAAHEEQERRAMDGELAELERAWRDAEEVAAIADDLLLPASVGERLGQLKGRSTARAGAASSPSSESGSATSS